RSRTDLYWIKYIRVPFGERASKEKVPWSTIVRRVFIRLASTTRNLLGETYGPPRDSSTSVRPSCEIPWPLLLEYPFPTTGIPHEPWRRAHPKTPRLATSTVSRSVPCARSETAT